MDQPFTGNQQLVKQLNENAVLTVLRRHKQLSRSQIARMTTLSHPTVSTLLDSLVERGRVLPVGHGRSTGGRKPLLFRFNPDSAFVVGVDCGATKVAAGLTNLDGKLLARTRIDRLTGPPDPFDRLLSAIREVLQRAPREMPVLGVGVGVPGVVDLNRGIVTLAPGLGWTNEALGERLERELSLPVYLENDVNTLLLGEHWLGAVRGSRNALCMAVGTGIGAAIMIDGQLYRGARDAAGEVGYMVTHPDDLSRPNSGYGYLERLAAGPGIAERARAGLRAGREAPILLGMAPGADPDRLSAKEVCQAAEAGDPLSGEVLEETARIIGIALANMVCLLNPEVVVLTGGVVKAGEVLMGPVRRVLSHVLPYEVNLVTSQLWEEAGILGSVALVLDATQKRSGALPEMEAGQP